MNDYRKHLPAKFQEVVDQFDQLGELMKVSGNIMGVNDLEKRQEIIDELDSYKKIISVITRFDAILQPLGWIVSESTSLETARAAIQLAKSNKIIEAERFLCADYEGDV
jgi:hypothetical protein